MPELWGGSADLAESNNTTMEGEPSFVPPEFQTKSWPGGPYGRTLHFGIREHAMGAILTGIALHGLTRPYGGTFFTFSDYMRGAVRLASLSGLHVVYVWTHDSIGLGEDGPTHQPVEHYAALRAIPNLWFVRPGDANEAAVAWALAIERHTASPSGPVALSLTRQKLPTLEGTATRAGKGVRRGGYVLREAKGGKPRMILMATGSELQLAMAAAAKLEKAGTPTRVVSLPCWELFEAQSKRYRESVLPEKVRKRVAIEVDVSLGWDRWVGDEGAIMGLDHFGASAPAGTIFEHFGFTPQRVLQVARKVLAGTLHGPVPTLEPGHLPAGGRTRPRAGKHPSIRSGDSGVARSSGSDPGHD